MALKNLKRSLNYKLVSLRISNINTKNVIVDTFPVVDRCYDNERAANLTNNMIVSFSDYSM